LSLTLVVALALGAFLVWGLPALLPDGTQVLIDGRPIDLGSAHAGHWLLATLVVLMVAAVIVFVVPLLIVLAVGVPLAMSALGMAIALLMLALALTPLVLLVWWLFKQADKKRTTIPPS
jgi:hypothetical protein